MSFNQMSRSLLAHREGTETRLTRPIKEDSSARFLHSHFQSSPSPATA
uniref:Uncharacterized protein n=1 Tax=Anguilla anguilla TaxID=7936 RepID=A0A0E9QBI1_ANGAN